MPTVVDSVLSEIGDIVVSANMRHEGLWMHFREFAAIEQPQQASFSRPIAAGPNRRPRGARKTVGPDSAKPHPYIWIDHRVAKARRCSLAAMRLVVAVGAQENAAVNDQKGVGLRKRDWVCQ